MARLQLKANATLEQVGAVVLGLASDPNAEPKVIADTTKSKSNSTDFYRYLRLGSKTLRVHFDTPDEVNIVVPYYPPGTAPDPDADGSKAAKELLGLVTIMGCGD